METQKIINLVNDSNNKKFDIRNGITQRVEQKKVNATQTIL